MPDPVPTTFAEWVETLVLDRMTDAPMTFARAAWDAATAAERERTRLIIAEVGKQQEVDADDPDKLAKHAAWLGAGITIWDRIRRGDSP